MNKPNKVKIAIKRLLLNKPINIKNSPTKLLVLGNPIFPKVNNKKNILNSGITVTKLP